MVFSNLMLRHWKEKLVRDGHVVIPGLYTQAECRRYARRIETFLTRCHGPRFQEMDERVNPSGIWDGVQNLRALQDIRSHPFIETAFRRICGLKGKLYPSLDRLSLRVPGKVYKEWWHWDRDPTLPGDAYQGFVALRDDTTLGIVRQSHVRYRHILERLEHPASLHLEPTEVDRLLPRLGIDQVSAPAGSLVIWNSRCLHSPLAQTPTKRLIVYVKYGPDKPVSHNNRDWSGFDYGPCLRRLDKPHKK